MRQPQPSPASTRCEGGNAHCRWAGIRDFCRQPFPPQNPNPQRCLRTPRCHWPAAPMRQWEGIEITFLSDERVQIHIGKTHETRNYAEFGFQDNKSKNPNRAWETLRRLAELRGIIRDGTQACLPWPKLEKRVQEIRRVFRKHFSISSDPLPFIKGTGFHARFKISCGPSFRS